MQSVGYYLIYPLLWFISILPFRVAYIISDILYVILYYLVVYRKETILKNLNIAFPNQSAAWHQEIHKQSTKHFCDTFIEIIKSMGMSKEAMRKRYTCENLELINQFADLGRSNITMLGHQASYEWSMVLDGSLNFESYAVYKPIKHKRFDNLIKSVRSKFGTTLVAMKNVSKVMVRAKEVPVFFGFIADQAPKPSRVKYFTNFFDTPTAVFRGGEFLAAKYDMSVCYLSVRKVKRGHYKSTVHVLSDNAANSPAWEITDRFFKLLEADIKKQPQYYLWSHKRWKSTLENVKHNVELSPVIHQ